MSAHCAGRSQSGEPCRQAPLTDRTLCFWHDPEQAQAAAEARRLGGVRRRREGTVAGAYDFEGLDSHAKLRRLLEVAAFDTLSLDNSIARVRALVAIVQAGAKLLEVGELEERLQTLEHALGPRLKAVPGRKR